ncbi:unnamed protein product [Eruca vesicaria subsp. sativa]|uniref:Uncharacterized protein n=1 Tax=Eruca vesicaria subsp. sativa TaxID=29727 RepID=A0ABC8KEF4_ERUVS|nr:unnamed protein product [Eruca vesicaria subsp. sativa]
MVYLFYCLPFLELAPVKPLSFGNLRKSQQQFLIQRSLYQGLLLHSEAGIQTSQQKEFRHLGYYPSKLKEILPSE